MDSMQENRAATRTLSVPDGNEITFRVQGAGKREIELRHASW